MTTKLPRITNLILALFLTAGLGCAEATDIKQTLIRTDQQLNAAYNALTKKNGGKLNHSAFHYSRLQDLAPSTEKSSLCPKAVPLALSTMPVSL